jgi:hypothetical protein
MTSPAFFRIVFALYCVEAGLFFTTAPWLPAWDRFAGSLPWAQMQRLAMSGWGRGALLSFGLLHFVWVIHDLELYLRSRGTDARASSEAAGGL